MTNSKISKTLLYVGTYTKKEGHVDGQAEGIYIFDYDTKTGSLTAVDTIPNTVNPSYLTVPPNGKYLYAVNEIAGNGNPSVGTVSAFELDEKGHFKRALNVVSAMGDAPCHISVDASEHYVLVANYMGSVAAFPIQKNGSLGAASSSVKHKLDNPGSGRQDAPHAHMILSGIDSTSVFAVDLGMDKVIHYELSAGQLTEQAKTALKEGAGGRHLVFHPSQKWVYVLNELNKTVGFFQYSNAATPFERLQTISTLEKPITEGDVGPSAIRIHPSGKFLYTANRGIQGNNNNSIATYSINAQSGQLAFLGLQAAKGAVPRDFAVSPDGQFLLVANQNSNTIVTFRIDEKTGELIETGIITEVKTPVCLQFFEK
ncbi:MAG: lactonase family protein [Bacteroidota bacterium]